ncbi:carboxymuconolactone decarboxylase family protein [Longispora albida]|uniref:carboxymuconolactone decarboxylase family protein n=1 Tax=Longispora albida TaxID=203523 RepID=UPI000372C131|nr:carboxymuconolactone decarboxylase family protein [Longispora albida]
MARIPLVEKPGVLGRLMYWYARRRFGAVPEPFMASMHHARLTRASAMHEMLVEKASSALPAAVRELAVYRAATQVGCSWCVDFGTMLQLTHGLSVDRLIRIDQYETSDEYSHEERLALRYADAMTAQPMTVTDEQVAELRTVFSDAQLVELTYHIGLENQRARVNKALGLTAQGYTSGDACAIPPR